MANKEHLAILRKGISEWHSWRRKNRDIKPDLQSAKLGGVELREANLRFANLSDIYLSGADLRGADLSASNLSNADMSEADLRFTKLRATNLTYALLQDVRLLEAELYFADLRGAHLEGANLRHTDLSDADLSGANLSNVELRGAELRGANLSGANLSGANFSDARILNTNFERAICGQTLFTNVDLSSALGLDTITHYSPTSIGIDTLYLSVGNIPREFLEGCGVPENMIVFAKSLVGQAFEYYSCFISHSSKDAEFCDRLAQQMRAGGLRVWYAPEDLKGGQKTYAQIDEAIHLYDKVIIVLSEASMNSNWVRVEIQRALRREKAENRRILFPITLIGFEALKNWVLVSSDGVDLAEEIREYSIPDFSQWKDHDKFIAVFKRFLANLRKNT